MLDNEKFQNVCRYLRHDIQKIATSISLLKGDINITERATFGDLNLQLEALANAQLAIRHLEDARMRLGKVMQMLQGGVSIYDRKEESNERTTFSNPEPVGPQPPGQESPGEPTEASESGQEATRA